MWDDAPRNRAIQVLLFLEGRLKIMTCFEGEELWKLNGSLRCCCSYFADGEKVIPQEEIGGGRHQLCKDMFVYSKVGKTLPGVVQDCAD